MDQPGIDRRGHRIGLSESDMINTLPGKAALGLTRFDGQIDYAA